MGCCASVETTHVAVKVEAKVLGSHDGANVVGSHDGNVDARPHLGMRLCDEEEDTTISRDVIAPEEEDTFERTNALTRPLAAAADMAVEEEATPLGRELPTPSDGDSGSSDSKRMAVIALSATAQLSVNVVDHEERDRDVPTIAIGDSHGMTSAKRAAKDHNAEHVRRLQQAGVSDDAIIRAEQGGASFHQLEPLPLSSGLRVLQWNILADGMSNDGFLVEDVLAVKDGERALEHPRDILAASDPLIALEASVQDPSIAARAVRNLQVVVDWEARYARMKAIVQLLQPDVIAFEELDHMSEMQSDLEGLGYECSLGGRRYAPMHAAGVPTSDPAAYLEHLRIGGVAFAPKHPSTCRKLATKRGAVGADDDGCAVFWRSEKLRATAISFIALPEEDAKRQCGAVRVELLRLSDGCPLSVICAHLASGDKHKDEVMRLFQVARNEGRPPAEGSTAAAPGLADWLMEGTSDGHPVLLCMDGNTAPDRTETETVWKLFRALPGVRSVWDDHFSSGGVGHRQGALRRQGDDGRCLGLGFPVTTNKMRGPLSEQKRKVGEHMLRVIDHIFYVGEPLGRSEHAWGPVTYATVAESHAHLLPSISCPSDHLPLVIDFAFPAVPPAPAVAEPAAEVVAPAAVAAPPAPEVIALAPAAAPPSPAISDEVLASYKKAFSVFDKDGSGAVCVSELNEILIELGHNLSAEELDAMVKEVDADGSGEIGFDQFCTCMQKAMEGGATAPKLAVMVEENGLLSGLKNVFCRLFDSGVGQGQGATRATESTGIYQMNYDSQFGGPPQRAADPRQAV